METSQEIAELAKALAKAQGQIQNAAKNAKNPAFKSSYAKLDACWDACREPLSSNGLSVVQLIGSEENRLTCTSILLHESGQFIKSTFSITPVNQNPQGFGSAATYARRYTLQALVGIAPDEDDDGNAASLSQRPLEPRPTAVPEVRHPKSAAEVKDKLLNECRDLYVSLSNEAKKSISEELKIDFSQMKNFEVDKLFAIKSYMRDASKSAPFLGHSISDMLGF
jgi:hypothetical protein